jgi:hypothetical protein
VTFNGAGGQQILGTLATKTFNTVVINMTAGQLLNTGGGTTTITVSGNLTETQGNFTPPATLTVTGSFTLTAGAFTAGTNFNIAGDLTKNGGTFTAGAGTVTFNGAAQAIGGSTTPTFNNLTLSGPGAKTASTAINISGALTINQSLTMSGSNVLTMQSTASQPTFASLTEITGNMTWQSIGASAYTFNNAQTIVTFSGADAGRTFTLKSQPATPPTGYSAGHTVNRDFNVSYSNWNTGTVTLQLAYLQAEASTLGVTETTLKGFDGGIAANHKLVGTITRTTSTGSTFGYLSYAGLTSGVLVAGELALDDSFVQFYSVAAAAWNVGSTWDAGVAPGAAADVVIDNNFPVSIPNGYAASAKSVTINATATGLTVGGGASGSLAVGTGGITNNSAGTGLTVAVGASVTITGADLTNNGSITNNGTIIVQ